MIETGTDMLKFPMRFSLGSGCDRSRPAAIGNTNGEAPLLSSCMKSDPIKNEEIRKTRI